MSFMIACWYKISTSDNWWYCYLDSLLVLEMDSLLNSTCGYMCMLTLTELSCFCPEMWLCWQTYGNVQALFSIISSFLRLSSRLDVINSLKSFSFNFHGFENVAFVFSNFHIYWSKHSFSDFCKCKHEKSRNLYLDFYSVKFISCDIKHFMCHHLLLETYRHLECSKGSFKSFFFLFFC